MDASLRCTAEYQFRVSPGDPSVMLPALHSPPPTHEIQGGLGWGKHSTRRCQSPRSFLKTSPWIWARKRISGLESWRQHPHWGLTSAASLEDVSSRALGHRQCREYLCTDGVDADGAVQLLFGQSTLDCSCKALCNFSSIWTQYVKAYNTLIVFDITDYFCVTFVVIS